VNSAIENWSRSGTSTPRKRGPRCKYWEPRPRPI
jgi:hypothetical protein